MPSWARETWDSFRTNWQLGRVVNSLGNGLLDLSYVNASNLFDCVEGTFRGTVRNIPKDVGPEFKDYDPFAGISYINAHTAAEKCDGLADLKRLKTLIGKSFGQNGVIRDTPEAESLLADTILEFGLKNPNGVHPAAPPAGRTRATKEHIKADILNYTIPANPAPPGTPPRPIMVNGVIDRGALETRLKDYIVVPGDAATQPIQEAKIRKMTNFIMAIHAAENYNKLTNTPTNETAWNTGLYAGNEQPEFILEKYRVMTEQTAPNQYTFDLSRSKVGSARHERAACWDIGTALAAKNRNGHFTIKDGEPHQRLWILRGLIAGGGKGSATVPRDPWEVFAKTNNPKLLIKYALYILVYGSAIERCNNVLNRRATVRSFDGNTTQPLPLENLAILLHFAKENKTDHCAELINALNPAQRQQVIETYSTFLNDIERAKAQVQANPPGPPPLLPTQVQRDNQDALDSARDRLKNFLNRNHVRVNPNTDVEKQLPTLGTIQGFDFANRRVQNQTRAQNRDLPSCHS